MQLNLCRMDQFRLCYYHWPQNETKMGEKNLGEGRRNAMTAAIHTTSMHALLNAIGRQLQDDYLPTARKPMPSELKDLVAQLVALESGRRGPTEPSLIGGPSGPKGYSHEPATERTIRPPAARQDSRGHHRD
jgi:hypothetical protein